MIIQGVFRNGLRITSKEKALEFYNGVKSVILIQYGRNHRLRIEPGQLISLVSVESINNDTALLTPSLYDEDGTLAYKYRKHINAYLASL